MLGFFQFCTGFRLGGIVDMLFLFFSFLYFLSSLPPSFLAFFLFRFRVQLLSFGIGISAISDSCRLFIRTCPRHRLCIHISTDIFSGLVCSNFKYTVFGAPTIDLYFISAELRTVHQWLIVFNGLLFQPRGMKFDTRRRQVNPGEMGLGP